SLLDSAVVCVAANLFAFIPPAIASRVPLSRVSLFASLGRALRSSICVTPDDSYACEPLASKLLEVTFSNRNDYHLCYKSGGMYCRGTVDLGMPSLSSLELQEGLLYNASNGPQKEPGDVRTSKRPEARNGTSVDGTGDLITCCTARGPAANRGLTLQNAKKSIGPKIFDARLRNEAYDHDTTCAHHSRQQLQYKDEHADEAIEGARNQATRGARARRRHTGLAGRQRLRAPGRLPLRLGRRLLPPGGVREEQGHRGDDTEEPGGEARPGVPAAHGVHRLEGAAGPEAGGGGPGGHGGGGSDRRGVFVGRPEEVTERCALDRK
ncbi:hypothetical protein THAOC_18772, partial [Thalassiosira oceanica]